MCITRAFSGLGLSISSPAGFGIIGVNIRHEPARTIVFASFGLGNPVGAAFGGLLGGTMAGIGSCVFPFCYISPRISFLSGQRVHGARPV